MIKKTLLLLTCLILLSGISAVWASQSFYGPTGLIVMPDAYTLDRNELKLFVNHRDGDYYKETTYGANMGLGYGLEVGATIIRDTGLVLSPKDVRISFSGESTTTIFNVKYALPTRYVGGNAVAVGAINAFNNKNFLSFKDGGICPYIVVSRNFPVVGSVTDMNWHLGYIGGDISSVMLGMDTEFMSRLKVMADWIGDFSDVSLGVRYQATKQLDLGASIIDGNFVFGAAYQLFLK